MSAPAACVCPSEELYLLIRSIVTGPVRIFPFSFGVCTWQLKQLFLGSGTRLMNIGFPPERTCLLPGPWQFSHWTRRNLVLCKCTSQFAGLEEPCGGALGMNQSTLASNPCFESGL